MPKPPKSEDEFLAELKRAYCNFCQNPDLRITQTIKIECKKCGKTRIIQRNLNETL